MYSTKVALKGVLSSSNAGASESSSPGASAAPVSLTSTTSPLSPPCISISVDSFAALFDSTRTSGSATLRSSMLPLWTRFERGKQYSDLDS